ncbi:MAG TPA: hypothetical protein VE596_02645 [Gaiellaceae bacterium]|jgi:hypothetical protein|nr:hypothetical protein [Gaiellaceae bacterium]
MTKRRSLLLMTTLLFGVAVAAFVLVRVSHDAGAVELPPVAHDMTAAFAAPVVPDAQLPKAVADAEEYLTRPGRALSNQTRRIGRALGKNSVDIYVFPTTQGKVCSVVTEAAAMGGCVPSFHLVKGEVASGVYSGETAPQTVTGLVSNRVAAISVRVGDRLEPVTVARNTFFWQAPTSDVTRGDIKGLVVRWHDGHRFDVNLDFGDA